MKKSCLFYSFLLSAAQLIAQVNIVSGSYSQNFGTSNITSWTNNSTFPGWYISATFQGNANLSASANSYNSGGFYGYNCGSDAKIGSRASGSASNLYYGVVLRNTTGQTIRSIYVSYTGYQMSLATNGNNMNTITFDYVTGTSAPSISSPGGTSVPALNFQQLQNSTTSGGSQLNWYPCTQSRALSSCIPLTLPNNSYILLRWNDDDDPGNDHHMAIDDIQVSFDLTGGTCTAFLPVELLYFEAAYEHSYVNLKWASASEHDLKNFTVERSADGISYAEVLKLDGIGDQIKTTTYQAADRQPLPGWSYYRLKQQDRDGSIRYSPVRAVSVYDDQPVRIYPNPSSTGIFVIEPGGGAEVRVLDAQGKLIHQQLTTEDRVSIDLSFAGKGLYTIVVIGRRETFVQKLLIE